MRVEKVSVRVVRMAEYLPVGGSLGTEAKFKSELLPGFGMELCGFPHMIFNFFP